MIRQRAAVRRSSPLGVQFVEADAEDVPLADASFDLAISECRTSIWCEGLR
jgi:ubiquinone/menaquinone biosynthesis C-methylase UbiE